MASTAPFDLTKLLQAPKKWTPRHLKGLNIREHHHLPQPLPLSAMLYQQTVIHITTNSYTTRTRQSRIC